MNHCGVWLGNSNVFGGHEQQEAFVTFKESLKSTPVLGYYDKNIQTPAIVDSSPVGFGMVLVKK
jgi:hypothetical protein